MSEVDCSTSPSVRARLEELNQHKPPLPRQRAPAPSPAPRLKPNRPPPPPPPAKSNPPLPPRKAIPPLPPRKKSVVEERPTLPPRRASTAVATSDVAASVPRFVPQRVQTAPVPSLPRKGIVPVPTPRRLPPLGAPPPIIARKLPPLDHSPIPPLPQQTVVPPSLPRKNPPLPARASNECPRTSLDGSRGIQRALPPPPPRSLPARNDSSPASTRSNSPPPIPASTRPPPVPRSTRPSKSERSAPTCLRHRSFTEVDDYAALQHPTTSLETLAHSLADPFPSHTDKARVIFTYLHHTVAYDVSGFFGKTKMGKQDPISVLRSGLSVCQGYSELFLALASAAGLDAVLVSGHGKGYGYDAAKGVAWPPTGHAWNAVRIDGGEWWLIDGCWGAGHLKDGRYNKCFSPEQFVSTPEEFGRRHFPKDERWLLTGGTWEEYQLPPLEMPTVYLSFTEVMGFVKRPECFGPTKMEAGGCYEIRFMKGPCACLPYEADGPEWLPFVTVDSEEGYTILRQQRDGRTWSAVVEVPAGAKKVNLQYVTQWDGSEGKGLNEAEFLKRVGRVGWAYGGLVEWVL